MDLASTGLNTDQWLIDELEADALGMNDTDTDEISVSDEWEYVDWTMVVTPRIVKPDGRLIVEEIDHTDIETIVIPEGTPCATYRIRFIAGNGGFGIAEIDEVLAPPPENDTFRLGIDTTTSHEIVANEPLIQSFKSGLKSNIRVTIELEIIEQNGVVGCRLVNPGMAPYEGAVIPVTGTDDGTKATIDHTHNHLPESVVEPRIYQLDIDGSPSTDQFFVEILDSQATPVRAQVVDRSLEEHSIDPHFVEFAASDAEPDDVHIYFCGVYGNDSESTCQECFQKELFGSPSETDTAAGDTVLLKDYKRSFGNDSDSELYGPYTAVTDEIKNIDSDAWGGRFQYQVEVESNELFMIPVRDLDIDIGKEKSLENWQARQVLSQLTKEGTPVAIGSDGEIEETDNEPSEPDDLDLDDEDEEDEEDEDDKPDDDDTDESQEESPPIGGDTMDRLTTIHMAKKQTDPLPAEKILKEAPNPGTPLLRPALDGELRPELYERALAHLVGGKNLILYGPPGSGKTRIAERLGHAMCSELHIEAANAEWTYQEVVGGYAPASDGGFTPTEGVLTTAAAGCEESLDKHGNPDWLLIDELNRANLDEAFGDVFTLLDLDHRSDSTITYAEKETQAVPLAFRILGTMNTEDQAQLFSLGYAFRRRFAFMEVPPAYEDVTQETVPSARRETLELKPPFQRLISILEPAAMAHFDPSESAESRCSAEADTTVGLPPLTTVIDPQQLYDAAVDDLSPADSTLEFPHAIMWFVQTLAENDVAEIGQGIILDTLRYVLAHYVLFPTETDWRVVDHAVSAYILPQLEAYTSELRRAETVATESDAIANFEAVVTAADEIGFASTATALETALESHEILR